MKPALSFFSALFFIPLVVYAGGVTGGNPEYKASATWLLLKKSPQGKVLFNGEWYSEYLLAKMMAPCGGTVGGTGMTDDFDGDGVCNNTDIDDDNDGVVDATESPACFYTSAEMATASTVTTPLAIGSGDNVNTLKDGTLTGSFNFTAQALANATILEFTSPTAAVYSSIDIQMNATTTSASNGFGATGATAKVQAFDGTAWVDISAATNIAGTTSGRITFPITNTTTAFSSYRIVGVGTANSNTNPIGELVMTAPTPFIGSKYPKSACSDDTDGDANADHQDLDSDGDGCSDSYEAGAISSETANHQFTAAPDANVNGLNDNIESATTPGTVNYSMLPYAYDSAKNLCTDTDHDNVGDLVDIDDDNDGVLDEVEMYCRTGSLSVTGSGSITDNNEFSYSEANDQFIIDYPYSFQNFNALFWSIDYQDNFTVTVKLDDGTTVGPLDGRVFFSTSDPSWVARWTTKGYPHASSDVNWNQHLGEYTGTPFNTGDVFYTSPITNNNNKAWGAVEFTVPQATESNGIDQIIITIKPGIGVTAFVEVEPLNVIPDCSDIDTDNDGIPNRLDLDSDGDGCPDTKEAILFNNSSVTTTPGDVKNGSGGMVTSTTTTDNATVPGPYGSNGFADALQSASNPDAYKYVYTYQFLATLAENNACTDNDGDGVADFALDLDSDDDGIPEAVESPSCFYTEEQAMDITEGVTSDFTWSDTQPLSNTYDDNTTSYGQVTPAINILNQSLITFELPIIDRATIDNVKLTTSSVAFGTGTWRLEGLNVATNTWEPLSASQAMNATGTTYTFTNTLQPNMAYHSYRIVGTSSTNVTNNARLAEFDIQYKNYNPSLHRVKTGCNSDTDNDGVPNFFDRDSDGDGCPDAVEAGVSGTLIPGDIFNAGMNIPADRAVAAGPYGSNGLADGVETSPESAVLNYTSTYNMYAIDPTVNVCTDTDGDGKNDLTDIDDDNDGILDAVESPSCFFSATEANAISKITSQFTSPDDDQSDGNIQLLHDGSTALTFNFNAVAAGSNPTGSNLFTIEYPFAVSLATLVVSDNISTTTNANAVVVGSNDGITWSAALSPSTVITTTPVSFAISASQPYKYYRIQTGSVPGALATANTIGEITSTLSGYVASAHPKPTCNADADNDGIANHHDLDSDGDGCADGMEGGTNDGSDGISSSNLVHSAMPGGNTGGAYTGTAGPVNYNLGNTVDGNGVPTIVSGGQVLGSAQNAASQPANCIPVAPPVATADTVINNTPGAPVNINVLTNDTGGDPAIPSTVNLMTSGTGTCEDTDNDGDCDKLTVPGEGIWTVTPAGVVTFTPDSSFTLDPTPISYTLKDSDGETSSPAQIVIDNVPVASNDMGVGAYGASVTVTVVANDTTGDAVIPATLQIVGTASPGDSLVVPGEGKWTVNTTTGAITFTPESGFRDDPTPINYTVQDASGNVSNSAQLLLDYSPMPVTLVSFSAGKTPEGVLLKWRTTDETNFDRFEIEQSAKPQNGFKKIGTVKGGGSDYRFLDLENHNGASYYRLKMVDRAADGNDGTYEYSRIVTITDLNGQQLHRVYPNPSGVRSVSIASVTAIESYAIYDVSGREIPVKMTEQNGKYQFTFDKDARSGLYVISYRSAGRTFSQQFVLSF